MCSCLNHLFVFTLLSIAPDKEKELNKSLNHTEKMDSTKQIRIGKLLDVRHCVGTHVLPEGGVLSALGVF